MTRKYKAIGFDWGGVLNGAPRNYFYDVITLMPGITLEKLKEVYFNYNQAFNRGEMTWRELWQTVLNGLGFADREDIVDKIIDMSEKNNADNLNASIVELIDTLRKNDYKVGLLSNNSEDGVAQMQRLGIVEHLDAFDVSIITGLVKPNPEAFTHLANGLGVNISELVFIDDTEKSLSTAAETGFTPIIFTSYSQLVDDLRKLGVKTD